MLTNPTGLPPVPERYEVLGEVAATPFERTLHARDRVLRRDVLLKLPAAAAFASWSVSVRDRLLREARALASVRHDAVLPILTVEETGAGPMLVLDLPEGELLTDRLRVGPLEIDAARELAIDVAEALGALHYASFVHRAVGPDAVYVRTDGHARLGAFTFAKEFGGHGGSSIDYRTGGDPRAPRCLPAYPAPEQLQGQAADPRCDVFALGCLLYRCLSGQEPTGVETGEVADLRSLRPDVPKDLAEVVRRCMAFARAARYPTAQAVADALKATRPAGGRSAAGDRVGRRGLIATLGLSVLLAAGGFYMWSRPPQEGDRSPSGSTGQNPNEPFGDTYAKCHALLIGIDAYSGAWTPLPNATRDVEAVAKGLKQNDPNWAVQVLPAAEATHERILLELDGLRDDHRVGREDAVLVYFAGHGYYGDPESEQYWLVGVNAATKKARTDPGFVHSDNILEFVKHCPAKHVLVVLDTCFGARVFAPIRGETLEPVRSAGARQHQFLRRRSQQILVSADERTPASDGAGALSPFCRAFLAAIEPRDASPRAVSSRSICQSIEEEMLKRGGGNQLPELKDVIKVGGCFVFFVPAKKP